MNVTREEFDELRNVVREIVRDCEEFTTAYELLCEKGVLSYEEIRERNRLLEQLFRDLH